MRSLLLIVTFLFCLTACGKRGPLYYPDMLVPSAPTVASVSQFGNSVKLQFVPPDEDRVGRKLPDLAGVRINRREIDSSQGQYCTSCTTAYRLFRTLYPDVATEGVQRYGKRIVLIDGDVRAGKSYSYILVPFTKDGVDGLASPEVSVRVVQSTAPPTLTAESFPTEIRISFAGSPPSDGHFLGYNLYRSKLRDIMPYLPINGEPMVKDYTDSVLDRNVKYRYMARSVARMESGDLVESPVSNIVEGMLKDDE